VTATYPDWRDALGHGAIIRMCACPFASVEEMDATLRANWNAAVRPSDTVIHLSERNL
jgi:calcineurin-like phosphoesterase family protein